ncbi:pyridoxamine 5'-phosphate oxidase family protein [Endozoicomonas sp. OPT23]|uniref:pyridoxamine 5'-phosphate oxidase family protein n=1 Tax=Endozoicomonas sp. OPT23 TaxID=2072845 RepID=UPI00129B1289|nr:pyridoxamine 5'-phosphate oxidase family protein [Endozoicomonas sp. OPT23]MRI32747.1 pyridoxamine 5'-phosphate oxidase family protein [Endozoicomonas sp. OPT23]
MEPIKETPKTRVKRGPKRAVFDREMLYQILDEARIAHVGFAVDDQNYVIPMLSWRQGDQLYIHGSRGSRMIKALTEGANCCVTATIVDGMVLSKSAFHHSTNYRSAVVFGQFRVVDDPVETNDTLKAFLDGIAPGRWEEVRAPTEKELKATSILAIELEEVSVKVRTGPANEDQEDLDLPVWTGEIKLRQSVTEMVADSNNQPEVKVPDYSEAWL